MSVTEQTVILADWGNSSGRLFCVKGSGLRPEVLETKRVIGAKDTPNCAAIFEDVAKHWIEKYGVTEALFCGAVTSNIGWISTEYAKAPARVSDVQKTNFTTDYGLPCTFLSGTSIASGPHGYFDTARGEDMQAYGWMALTGLTDGILCAPGTHTKWMTVKDGAITNILTGVTGESYEVLNTHSMLTRGAKKASYESAEFCRGIDAMNRTPRPALTHMLMSVRNLQLSGEIEAAWSADYLSGLLTGEDCVAALEILPAGTINIIGDGLAVNRYARTLSWIGRNTHVHDGQACVIAGLQSVRA